MPMGVKYIDGISTYNVPPDGKEKSEYYLDKSDSLELLPGQHAIKFALKPDDIRFPAVVYFDANLDVEAGKTYAAVVRTQATGRTVLQGRTGDETAFWVEIAEFKGSPAAIFNRMMQP